MSSVRRLLAHRRLAVLICATAMLLKMLVPTGYMIDNSHGRIAIVICPDAGPATMTMTMTMTMAMPGMDHSMSDHGGKASDKADAPCAFASLSAAAIGAIDPVQLAAAIAFVMALGLRVVLLAAPLPPAHLRPPLRGPPAYL